LLFAQGSERIPTPGVTQQFLVATSLSQLPGKQITVFAGEFEPGASTPSHRHPGTELLYVLEGNGVMHISGRESVDLTAGQAVLVQLTSGEDHFIHQAINSSDSTTLKTLVMVIHDTDTPPALSVD
jgi:quercetin dioxygenase-like cupin family protein